ncbi:hypothetical protein Phi46:3_gp047 [Cellulophaga phage phi46:3]|uniref:Uncharacterized protein n=1 Tax=Cellulophaga phage phi46:3 TaxID=1327985 RepID=S0A090_9CAUD|nr:hypothetical protein Phi46:3_gp047 [Cellulophaga phage phi46:3]AGO48791.1 hypothetical protein Phi46:3_gp047 [Cellulophaga phage phi46:3]
MKALLTSNYIYIQPFSGFRNDKKAHDNFVNWVKENQGKWVDIDTKFLFSNQYNTTSGFRIYDTMIDKIIDDKRPEDTAFFKKHPDGKDTIKKVDFKDHLKNKRFLSCSSVNGNYYRISRRENIEFILVGEKIYLTNGIGYRTIKESDLSNNEIKILKYCVKRILNNENLNNLYNI